MSGGGAKPSCWLMFLPPTPALAGAMQRPLTSLAVRQVCENQSRVAAPSDTPSDTAPMADKTWGKLSASPSVRGDFAD